MVWFVCYSRFTSNDATYDSCVEKCDYGPLISVTKDDGEGWLLDLERPECTRTVVDDLLPLILHTRLFDIPRLLVWAFLRPGDAMRL